MVSLAQAAAEEEGRGIGGGGLAFLQQTDRVNRDGAQ